MDTLKDQDLLFSSSLRQFLMESQRLEEIYANLEKRFTSIQESLERTHLKLAGKLSELNFLAHYLETILNHVSQGIIFIDLNGIVTTYNLQAFQIFNIPNDQLLFQSYHSFFDDTFFGFSINGVFHSKVNPVPTLISWTRNDQKQFELEIEANLIRMQSNDSPIDIRQPTPPSLQGLLILIRNVTELHQLQLTANRNDRLKDLGIMAAHLAHEIRNPLGGIKGFASLLVEDLQDRPQAQQMARSIAEGTDKLNQLVTAILQYTRPLQCHFSWTSIGQLIEKIGLFIQSDPSWNPKIEFTFQDHTAGLKIRVDPLLIESAMINLILNATQSMPDGGFLEVQLNQKGEEILISVHDSGNGIPQEAMGNIFSPFFTTKASGTGLGLAEVSKVVQAHNGTITVKSEVGKGSIFTIKLPINRENT